MNLYKIHFLHYTNESTVEGLKEYLVADSDEGVYHYVDKEYNNDNWNDFSDFSSNQIIEAKGDINLDDRDDEAYYGVTLFGWELIKENIDINNYSKIIELGVINKI